MKVLKRAYDDPSVDEYPYVVNIGYHNDIINLVTCSPSPSEVLVNGNVADSETIVMLIEKLSKQFSYRNCAYALEEK